MRAGALAIWVSLIIEFGCGYVGPVVPPSPQIPNTVTDLHVSEQGDQLVITFSTPARTTDNLPIREFKEIDLRIGPAITPFDFDRWAATARNYEVAPPPPNDRDDPKPNSVSDRIPVSDWAGQRVAVGVRTTIRSKDHYSQWSRVVLNVISPLQPPKINKPEGTAEGARISWPSEGAGVQYRVLRKGPGDQAPVDIGTTDKAEFLDSAAQYDTHYEYQVVAMKETAESLPSEIQPFSYSDTFAPSIPAGVAALATPNGIEVSWHRSPESDLKGYYLYRSVNGGPFERQGSLIVLPTYSDHSVEHGKTYRYKISATDQKNNESDKSAAVEVIF